MERHRVQFEMQELYGRYRGGDQSAVDELEVRFAPLFQCIIRRIVRKRSAASGLDEHVLSEAGRLLERESMGVFSSEHARILANRILQTVAARTTERRRPFPRGMETVLNGILAHPTALHPV